MDVGKGHEHDCMDAGGRAPKVGALGDAGAVAEERKLFRLIREVFAGNASSRCRSNRLIPACRISVARTARHRNFGEPKNIKASAW